MDQYTSDQELQIWALGGFKVENQDQHSVGSYTCIISLPLQLANNYENVGLN